MVHCVEIRANINGRLWNGSSRRDFVAMTRASEHPIVSQITLGSSSKHIALQIDRKGYVAYGGASSSLDSPAAQVKMVT